MISLYLILVKNKLRTIDQIPFNIRDEVVARLIAEGYDINAHENEESDDSI